MRCCKPGHYHGRGQDGLLFATSDDQTLDIRPQIKWNIGPMFEFYGIGL